MSVTARALKFTIKLGQGPFGEQGYNTVVLPPLRATARIAKVGQPAFNTAEIAIYGLDQSLMNEVSRVGLVPNAERRNIVIVEAGDVGGNMALAFVGAIVYAYTDFEAIPEVPFNITAATGYLQQLKPIDPSSYPGATDIVVIMQSLAKQMGYTLENSLPMTNGSSGIMLSNPYLPGTARKQAIAAAEAANINVFFEDDQGIMALYPINGSRATIVPEISAQSGMVGYPKGIQPGYIGVRTLYNPALRFGGNVKVASSQTPANGLWRVTQLVHSLSTQMPNGDWFSDVIGNRILANAA